MSIYQIVTKIDTEKDMIFSQVERTSGLFSELITTRILFLLDDQTERALKRLGWTPPQKKEQSLTGFKI